MNISLLVMDEDGKGAVPAADQLAHIGAISDSDVSEAAPYHTGELVWVPSSSGEIVHVQGFHSP